MSIDLARELATRLNVPVEFVVYTAAGAVVEGVRSGAWDMAYLAVDPERTADVDFTPPYVEIEGFVAALLKRHGIEGAIRRPSQPVGAETRGRS